MRPLFIQVNITLNECLSLMSKHQDSCGMAIVIDEDQKFLGVFTLGDLSKKLLNDSVDPNEYIENYYNRNPSFFYNPISDRQVVYKLLEYQKSSKIKKRIPRYIPILNIDNTVNRCVQAYDILSENYKISHEITVVGMGFVGLTLAIVLTQKKLNVIGYDINDKLINNLNSGKSHVNEPRINILLQQCLDANNMSFTSELVNHTSDVYIVCVGTPVNNKEPDNEALVSSLITVGRNLKIGDLIIIRSTVSIGLTRNIVIPTLEKYSELKVGRDIFVSYSPERTVQGNAIHEIENLPQLVAGYSPLCLKKSIEFWRHISHSVIQLDSLEACELSKLANNAYRDVTFSFANGLSQVCAHYQINSQRLIAAINEGYPRSNVPKPSPGVGGYCLTKDPFILASSEACSAGFRSLLNNAREINNMQIDYLIKDFNNYLKQSNLNENNVPILIIGLAFKGLPITNDMRFSPALDLAKSLSEKHKLIYGYDTAIDINGSLNGINIITNDSCLLDIIKSVKAIFIMNNNPNNVPENLLELIQNKAFLSDPWGFFSSAEIKMNYRFSYSTLGRFDYYDNHI